MKLKQVLKMSAAALLTLTVAFTFCACSESDDYEQSVEYAEVNGVKLAYTVSGEGAPVLLIHGNAQNHTIFDVLIKDLAEDYTVYAVDSRGHGKSEDAETLSYYDMAQDMECFIDQVIGEKTLVYGFSDGGIIGLIMASEHPQNISKLICSGANSNPQGVKWWSYWQTKILYFFKRDPKDEMMLNEPNLTAEDLGKISVPTVILAAENDLIKEEDTRFIAKSIPDSTLQIIEGESHSSYVTHSDKLYGVLKPYLE